MHLTEFWGGSVTCNTHPPAPFNSPSVFCTSKKASRYADRPLASKNMEAVMRVDQGNTSLQNRKGANRDISQTKKKFESNVTTCFVDLLSYPVLCLNLKCMYQGKRIFSPVTKNICKSCTLRKTDSEFLNEGALGRKRRWPYYQERDKNPCATIIWSLWSQGVTLGSPEKKVVRAHGAGESLFCMEVGRCTWDSFHSHSKI